MSEQEQYKQHKFKYVIVELAHHLPFSIFGVTVGLIVMGFLTFFATLMQAETFLPEASEELFHIFHPHSDGRPPFSPHRGSPAADPSFEIFVLHSRFTAFTS